MASLKLPLALAGGGKTERGIFVPFDPVTAADMDTDAGASRGAEAN